MGAQLMAWVKRHKLLTMLCAALLISASWNSIHTSDIRGVLVAMVVIAGLLLLTLRGREGSSQ